MSYYAGDYEVAVIGAGHAGCEAALACSRKGHKTLLFSISLECVANMPCNPNIGGTSKGHLVREIDALGGEMGKNIDKTFIQSRMLNTSKGPAVYSLRAQAHIRKTRKFVNKTSRDSGYKSRRWKSYSSRNKHWCNIWSKSSNNSNWNLSKRKNIYR